MVISITTTRLRIDVERLNLIYWQVDKVKAQLPRLHALAIGPGLGREPAVLAAVSQIITAASSNQIPLVIDADGLWIINQKPELVTGCANGGYTLPHPMKSDCTPDAHCNLFSRADAESHGVPSFGQSGDGH